MTQSEARHMAAVQSLGCIVCRNLGLGPTPAEIHHPLKNGRRMGHKYVLPICFLHHRKGVNTDQHVSRHPWKREFERRYGTERELLGQTERDLAMMAKGKAA